MTGSGPAVRRCCVAALVAVVAASAPGCARSELDICVDRLMNIVEKRQSGEVVRQRCIDAIEQNDGKSPF